jgi:hypothetical protein
MSTVPVKAFGAPRLALEQQIAFVRILFGVGRLQRILRTDGTNPDYGLPGG